MAKRRALIAILFAANCLVTVLALADQKALPAQANPKAAEWDSLIPQPTPPTPAPNSQTPSQTNQWDLWHKNLLALVQERFEQFENKDFVKSAKDLTVRVSFTVHRKRLLQVGGVTQKSDQPAA